MCGQYAQRQLSNQGKGSLSMSGFWDDSKKRWKNETMFTYLRFIYSCVVHQSVIEGGFTLRFSLSQTSEKIFNRRERTFHTTKEYSMPVYFKWEYHPGLPFDLRWQTDLATDRLILRDNKQPANCPSSITLKPMGLFVCWKVWGLKKSEPMKNLRGVRHNKNKFRYLLC